MQSYKLKLTALTPIHIGTGEVYEPTNFVIDDGHLYEFDEVLFYKHLPESQKKEFQKIVDIQSKNGYELFEKIHAFVIKNKQYAKDVSINKIKVSKALEEHYKKSIAQPVQKEGKTQYKSVFNKFEIQKTQRLANKVSTFLSGSSIKGAISTAYQEYIYKKEKQKGVDKYFDARGDKLFRNLSISDSVAQKADSQIGYAINKERFESEDDAEISTFVEINSKGSEFLILLDIKELKNDEGKIIDEIITKEKIVEVCNQHYKLIYEDKESHVKPLKENQFLLSIGKHSGARAVTIAGLRKILVKLAQIQNKRDEGDDAEKRVERLYKKSHFENEMIASLFTEERQLDDKEKRTWRDGKNFIENPSELEQIIKQRKSVTINAILTEETTVWKFGESKDTDKLDSFGWVLCEFISDDEFKKELEIFKVHESTLIKDKENRQKDALQAIQTAKLQVQKETLAKEQKRVEEEQKLEDAKKAKAQEFAQMSPLERKITELESITSMPKTTLILKNIQNAVLEEFKDEALGLLKKLMIENKEWKEQPTGKNPAKDKEYQRTLEVKKLIG